MLIKARIGLLLTMMTPWLAFPLFAAFDKAGVLGIGARPLGMGDAFVAIADEGAAVNWNPAGLTQLRRMEGSAFFGPLLNGKEYYLSGNFSMPFYEETALAFTATTLYHNTGSSSTDAYENDYEFSAALPLNVDKSFSIGVNLKYLQYLSQATATLSDGTTIQATAGAMGMDLGMLYQVPLPEFGKKFSVGFFAQDLDTVLHWESGSEERVPLMLQVGAAYWIEENLVVTSDFSFLNDTNISGQPLAQPLYDSNGNTITSLEPEQYRPHVGVEGWFFNDHLGLRTGYTGFATTAGRFTAGVSYKAKDFRVDYAYIGHAEHLGDSHRFSGTYYFGAENAAPSVVSLVLPPTNIKISSADGSVNMTWNANPDPHVTGYSIYMSKAPGTSYTPIKKRIKENQITIEGLNNGTRYYFVVTSVNNSWPAVESVYSQEVSAVPGPIVPTAPGQQHVDNTPKAQSVLKLKGLGQPLGTTAGYRIYYSKTPNAADFVPYNTLDNLVKTDEVTIPNVDPDTLYYWRFSQVTNQNPPVESPLSQIYTKKSEPAAK